MDSPGQSSGTTKAADFFEDLLGQLRESHHNALQELEAKVSKLKKDRCLDAQRLEVFYNRNQQLKEQNKTLQDAFSLLEERLRAGECNRCAILEENLKNNQDQNLHLVAKLKNERSSLEDENRKLHAEIQKLKMSRNRHHTVKSQLSIADVFISSEPQEASSTEQEEGIIPDSPVLSSSLPVANRLKKRKHIDKTKHVRYAEMPLSQPNNSLFKELNKEAVGATRNPGRAEVLVPNTCELDASQISNVSGEVDEAIAETCGLELVDKRLLKTEIAAGQQRSSNVAWRHDVRLKPYCSSPSSTLIHNPDSTTERSPSLLPCVKRLSEDGSITKAKRRKDENDRESWECNKQRIQANQREGKRVQPEVINQAAKSVHSAQNGTSGQTTGVSCISPAFKKPISNTKGDGDGAGKNRAPLQSHGGKDAERRHTVEPMWSIDPALALSMYDSEWRKDEEMEEQQRHGELVDTDCTWVSHSLLQCRGESSQNRGDGVTRLGEKANDSLDMMFDTTAYGEYKSFNSSRLDQTQPCDDDEDEEEDEEKEEEEDDEHDGPEDLELQRKARRPSFAHVAVIRKKDERRKLKGTTCKECEVYYAHLPEEEKEKKLSACSRHRFLYIPPSTPENFWEVGFPSTQTCIDRGYIREEKNPAARSRRRQPLNALFTPQKNQQES